MKKIVSIAFLYFILNSLNAQTNAIGLRLGGGSIIGAEISYQQWIAENNRIEIDLGFGGGNLFNVMQITGLYQWIFEIEDPLLWYIGAGASTGFWNYEDEITTYNDGGIFLNVNGDIGIEYSFDIPLQISLDLRPQIGLINAYGDFDGTMGFGIRYQF